MKMCRNCQKNPESELDIFPTPNRWCMQCLISAGTSVMKHAKHGTWAVDAWEKQLKKIQEHLRDYPEEALEI